MLLTSLFCKWIFFHLPSFIGLLHPGVWNNPGSKGTPWKLFLIIFPVLLVPVPEMLTTKDHVVRGFCLQCKLHLASFKLL